MKKAVVKKLVVSKKTKPAVSKKTKPVLPASSSIFDMIKPVPIEMKKPVMSKKTKPVLPASSSIFDMIKPVPIEKKKSVVSKKTKPVLFDLTTPAPPNKKAKTSLSEEETKSGSREKLEMKTHEVIDLVSGSDESED